MDLLYKHSFTITTHQSKCPLSKTDFTQLSYSLFRSYCICTTESYNFFSKHDTCVGRLALTFSLD